jgi:hypothetical protein
MAQKRFKMFAIGWVHEDKNQIHFRHISCSPTNSKLRDNYYVFFKYSDTILTADVTRRYDMRISYSLFESTISALEGLRKTKQPIMTKFRSYDFQNTKVVINYCKRNNIVFRGLC